MRKTPSLIIVLNLCLLTVAFAQKKPVKETGYFSEDGINYRSYYISNYTYYPDCREKTYTESALTEDSVVYYGYKLLFEYDASGNELRHTDLNYDTATMNYDTSSRRTSTYNKANQEISSLYEDFNSGRWYPDQRDTAIYTVAGQVMMHLYQRYSGTANAFLNDWKQTFIYNAANQLAYEVDSSGDYQTGVLSPYYQTYYTYDAHGFQFMDSMQQWNSNTKRWENFHVNKSYKNSSGQEDSAVWQNRDGSLFKTYYSYYPSGNYRQYTSYSYDTSNVLTGGDRTTYIQDPYRVINDSFPRNQVTISEDLNVAADTFYITSTTTDTVLYNADSTQSEFQETERLPDGSVTNEPSKTFYEYIDCPATALPVTVLQFAATRQGEDAIVNWKTANETGIAYYTVQRSPDGATFTDIGRVTSKENAGSNTYSYTDKNITSLGSRYVYYRLAEASPDGSVVYSAVARVDLGNSKVMVSISPNPVRDAINIRSSLTLMNALITVSDMQGHILYKAKHNLTAGEPLPVNCSSFAGGVYVVSVQTEQVNVKYKVVK